ncbi:ACES Acetylcholinesterase, partial [Halcyon senegalensis]|nr:ACES Acetylcholinesterase [Halcyon senegalensis]
GRQAAAFLGIPYAQPPLGPLRFRPPRPAPAWGGVFEATGHRQACYQAVDTMFPGFGGSEMWNPNRELSEDCLYLNVWTPAQPPAPAGGGLPVLVWIYGGGFYSGAASLDVYDGRYLAAVEGLVVVSMNYRVGALGFLAIPGHPEAPGNVGLMDQRLALRWVQKNIRSFGGDPAAVTLFGESAGAASVGLHLLSGGGGGTGSLFRRAVLQSGSPNGPWATVGAAEGRRRAATLGQLVGCGAGGNETELLSCLRSKPAAELVEREAAVLPQQGVFRFAFVPVVDGDFLADTPEALLGVGGRPEAEVLLGAVQDEGTYFLVYGVPGFGKDNESLISREEFLGGVRLGVPQANELAAEAVVLQYTDWLDQDNPVKNREALDDIVGDHNVVCPLMQFAQRWAERGGTVFSYLFDHRASTLLWPPWMGVPHGYEIEFVFGQPLNPKLNYTAEEEQLSHDDNNGDGMSRRRWNRSLEVVGWGVVHGEVHAEVAAGRRDPNEPSERERRWPPYTASGQRYARLNARPLAVAQGLRAQACAFWTRFLPKLLNVTGEGTTGTPGTT